ncbi:unnamed protein product [Gongylonema pulchrum]|uniref:glucuronosyltransferase n=1 Tax=Gongylonema pulchrum TaxID=637853 RepID=A0A183DV97_9BILA|nr:unnamed protein product [Gongylonema pulchrum]
MMLLRCLCAPGATLRGFIGLFVLATLWSIAGTADILIMPSSLYPVHRYTMRVLAEELVKRGHDSKLSLPSDVHETFWRISSSNPEIRDLYLHRNHSVHSRIWTTDFSDDAERTTAWLASIEMCDQKFTAVIIDDLYNPCGLLLAGLQKTPFIYWSMSALRTESAWAHQSPSPPSYLPVPGSWLTDDLSFLQRYYNFASYFRALFIHQHLILRRIDKLFKKYYGDLLPEAFYIERNASVNFVNTPQIFDFARPYMPRVTFVGGIQCRNATPLTGDLRTFVDESDEENGFVLFTVGFTGQWKFAPKDIIESFVQAFAELPEKRFIWQYNGPNIPNLPSNVYIAEWLPQQNLLESVWHGVPVIGIPLTTAGYDNLLRLTARDVGIFLRKQNLNKESIKDAIREIYNPKYKKEMLTFQDMLVDVPYTELNHSAFWVEFIERHNEVCTNYYYSLLI